MKRIWNFIKRVFIAVFVMVIIGIIIDAILTGIKTRARSDESQLDELKEEKAKYYEGLRKAKFSEKWIYIVARSIISVLILAGNYFYYVNFNATLDWNKQAAVNEMVLLGYSFLAFSIAGTPKRFVKSIRTAVYNFGKRWHVGQVNINEIEARIKDLEERIRNKTACDQTKAPNK